MKMDIPRELYYWLAGAGVVWLFARARVGAKDHRSYLYYAGLIIPEFESFSATPYWDVSRYSWGYGTRAPGATGRISEEQARADMLSLVRDDYDYLSGLITVPLSPIQWAVLLSFSYNTGRGNADNLVDNINAQRWDDFAEQFSKYVYADGKRNETLVQRRARELQYFFS